MMFSKTKSIIISTTCLLGASANAMTVSPDSLTFGLDKDRLKRDVMVLSGKNYKNRKTESKRIVSEQSGVTNKEAARALKSDSFQKCLQVAEIASNENARLGANLYSVEVLIGQRAVDAIVPDTKNVNEKVPLNILPERVTVFECLGVKTGVDKDDERIDVINPWLSFQKVGIPQR